MSKIKYLLSIPVALTGLFFFLIFRRTPNFFYQSYVRSYCITGGFIQVFFSYILKILNFKKKIDYSHFKTLLVREYNFNDIIYKIKENGYFFFDETLKEDLINSLIQFSLKTQCFFFDESGKKNFTNYNLNSDEYISNKYDYDENDLFNNDLIKSLIFDKTFLKIAENYFGSIPLYSYAHMWWSPVMKKDIDLKTELVSQSAQLYHFDLDRIKWLKFFIYLTDTTEYDGPHEYVEGSNRVFYKPSEILNLGYQRIPSTLVKKYFSGKLKKIIGKKGTIFVGDTSAIHRGAPPLKNSRLVLVIEYANCLFGAKYKKIDVRKDNKIYDKYQSLIKEKIIN